MSIDQMYELIILYHKKIKIGGTKPPTSYLRPGYGERKFPASETYAEVKNSYKFSHIQFPPLFERVAC